MDHLSALLWSALGGHSGVEGLDAKGSCFTVPFEAQPLECNSELSTGLANGVHPPGHSSPPGAIMTVAGATRGTSST